MSQGRRSSISSTQIPPPDPPHLKLLALTRRCNKSPQVSGDAYHTRFSRFGDLPTELRLDIWTLAAYDVPGRIIPLSCTPGASPMTFHTISPYPMLATVSREARAVVAQVLKSLVPGSLDDGQQLIIVDHQKDVLLLASDFTSRQLRVLRAKIGSDNESVLSVAHEFGNQSTSFLAPNSVGGNATLDGTQIFHTFPKLEALIIVPVWRAPGANKVGEIGERATRMASLRFGGLQFLSKSQMSSRSSYLAWKTVSEM